MKKLLSTLLLILGMASSNLIVAQSQNNPSGQANSNLREMIYKKEYLEISKINAPFSFTKFKVIKLFKGNSVKPDEQYLRIYYNRDNGESGNNYSANLSASEISTLVNFLVLMRDTLDTPPPSNSVEYTLKINNELTATIYSNENGWMINYEIGDIRKTSIFFKPDRFSELYEALTKALFIMKS